MSLPRFYQQAKILPLLLTGLLTLLSTLPVQGADYAETWQTARASFFAEQHEQALTQLAPLLQEDTPSSWQQRGWMLAGKSLLALGRPQEAKQWFEKVSLPENEHYDLWLYYRAQSHLQAQEYERAFYLLELLLQHPRYESYLDRIREDLAEYAQAPEAGAPLLGLMKNPQNPVTSLLEDDRIYRLYSAAAQRAGQPVPLEQQLLAWKNPNSETAARQTQQLIEQQQTPVSDDAVRDRVRSLRRLRDRDYLLEQLPLLMKGRSAELRAELGKLYIRTLFLAREYSRMVRIYQREEFQERYAVPEAAEYYWMMRAYQRLKRTKDARFLLYKLEKEHPQSFFLPLGYEQMASYYQGQREYENAAFWWRRFIERVPKHRDREGMLWNLAWHHSRGKGFLTALKYLDQGLQEETLGPETEAKFLYWSGQFHLRLQQNKEAQESFVALAEKLPNTYYGLRLRRDQPDLFPPPQKPKALTELDLQLTRQEASFLQHCEFLFEVLESDLAVWRIRQAFQDKPSQALVLEAGMVLQRYQEYHALQKLVAGRFIQSLKSQDVDGQPVWTMVFPRPYWEQVQHYSEDAGIDPYWALAIMREESLFDPQAVSYANAMGLMQLMPATAKDVASWKNMNLRIPDDIFNPHINAQLGTSYLGHLARRFEEELILTAGSYNAGPGNMNKWLKRIQFRSIDEFVEDIPFEETRNYVKRVYRTYQIYKQLYQS